jgi:hypothetical protein
MRWTMYSLPIRQSRPTNLTPLISQVPTESALTMASQIDHLPVEILKMILRQSRNNGTIQDYGNALAVNETFRGAGEEYAFETISLDNDSVAAFRHEIQVNPSKVSKTQALFVHFRLGWPYTVYNHSDAGATITFISDEQKRLNDSALLAIELLRDSLQHFKSLTTFSLFISRPQENNPLTLNSTELRTDAAREYSCTLDRTVIKDVIAAIPNTVVNLEIDTHGLDRFGIKDIPADEPHACGAIRSILPQLKHCRLRLATLCPDFFQDNQGVAVKAKRLETLAINFSLSAPHLNPRFDATKSTHRCDERGAVAPGLDSGRSQLIYRPYLESKLRAAAGSWKNLKRLETYFATYAQSVNRNQSTIVTNHCDINDLLAGKTTILPAHVLRTHVKCDSWIIGRLRSDVLLAGPGRDFEEAIEGSWLTTSSGGRYPASFFRDSEGHAADMGVYLRAPGFQDFANWRSDWYEAMKRSNPVGWNLGGHDSEREIVNDAEILQVIQRDLR